MLVLTTAGFHGNRQQRVRTACCVARHLAPTCTAKLRSKRNKPWVFLLSTVAEAVKQPLAPGPRLAPRRRIFGMLRLKRCLTLMLTLWETLKYRGVNYRGIK